MKILYVCNNLALPGNGISTSARNITAALRKEGVEVRVLAGENSNPDGIQPEYRLKHFYFPVFQPIIDANGFSYAAADKKIMREAVEWADIIHLEEPLPIEKMTMTMAQKMGKPVVGTFHMYTNNILSEIPYMNGRMQNALLMHNWKRRHYNQMSDIQCPTEVVRQHLEDNHVKARLHVISNGITIPEEKVVAKPWTGGPINIIKVGRFVKIKCVELLLDAMPYSRHAKEIQLIYAGTGVLEKKLKARGEELYAQGILAYKPKFVFLDNAGLKKLAQDSYLCVHSAKMEVEGLGCMEALREGTVPVIAKGKYIGTSSYALDERSVFPSGDAKALAEKIDWWIEHPEERNRMAQVYADKAREYDIQRSARSLIEMYRNAIENNK